MISSLRPSTPSTWHAESGKFEPQKIPDKYAETLRELLRAKVEQRAPQIEVATEGKAPKEVINIMAALKESMQAKGRAKVRDAMRRNSPLPSWFSLKPCGRVDLETQ
jgi:non-homologous end joining protein Ku